jgi:hypothetical protein
MNKWGLEGERTLTKRYKDALPANLEIRITNPKGIVIMGQSKNFSSEQMADFEIIKRKYNNVIDVFSYDDLIQRVERLVGCFK